MTHNGSLNEITEKEQAMITQGQRA